MKVLLRAFSIIALAGLVAGCDPTVKRPSDEGPAVVEGRDGSGSGTSESGAQTQGAAEASRFQGHPLDNPQGPLSERVVYFAYDQYSVDPRYRSVLDAHARYLADNPAAVVVVEGHADERGSREYNVGLGERRALAVRQFLLFQGAGSNQVSVVSYGEERPAAEGHTESAWRLNRRVELKYPSR